MTEDQFAKLHILASNPGSAVDQVKAGCKIHWDNNGAGYDMFPIDAQGLAMESDSLDAEQRLVRYSPGEEDEPSCQEFSEIARMKLRSELIVLFEWDHLVVVQSGGLLTILQTNGSYVVQRDQFQIGRLPTDPPIAF